MAIKTTIGPKGVVSERIAGTSDVLVVDVESPRENVRTITSGSGVISVTGGTNLFIAPVTPTASLPGVGSEEVGTRVLLMKDDNTATVLVSGTNPMNAADTLVLNDAFAHLELLAVKGDDDGSFVWHVLHTSGVL